MINYTVHGYDTYPFTEDNKIDFNGFETLIDRQISMGLHKFSFLISAGER